MIDEPNPDNLADSIARACRELPDGSATDQLRNFCGRSWDMMHTPEFAAAFRSMVGRVGANQEARSCADAIVAPLHRALQRILERGVAQSEFRMLNPCFASRMIVAALIQQAFWCNHAEELGLSPGRGCNRVVTDTLSIVLGGIARA